MYTVGFIPLSTKSLKNVPLNVIFKIWDDSSCITLYSYVLWFYPNNKWPRMWCTFGWRVFWEFKLFVQTSNKTTKHKDHLSEKRSQKWTPKRGQPSNFLKICLHKEFHLSLLWQTKEISCVRKSVSLSPTSRFEFCYSVGID